MGNLAKERVLVVDDEPQVLVALQDLLSDRFLVYASNDPEEALAVATRDREIAVVVTDQRMPKITGDELLARLGSECLARRILLTGFADIGAVARAVNEGQVSAYVTKPWDPPDLKAKVTTAANQFRLSRELARERALLADLMNNVPDGVFFKDEQLRFQRANAAFARLVGVEEPTQMLNKTLDDVDPQFDPDADVEERRILERGKPSADQLRRVRTGTAARWLSETKAPIHGPDGYSGIVGIVRDVTERVEAADALRASEARLREQTQVLTSILESMDEGVIVADELLGVLVFNEPAQRILGANTPLPSLGDWARDLGLERIEDGAQLPPEADPLLCAMAGRRSRPEEVRVRSAQVDRRIVVVGIPLRAPDGEHIGAVVVLRDVTEQRRLEDQLRQIQKMEAVGQLASGIAHDFNNLLAIVLSYAHLLRADFSAADPRRGDLQELIAAAERAAALTHELLAFSRLRTGEHDELDLNGLVRRLERMFGQVLPAGVQLVTDLDARVGSVWADEGRTEQVLLNLVVNARDALAGSGTLTIRTSPVSEPQAGLPPDASRSNREVLLSVEDDGCGMPPDVRQRIFEPFFTTKPIGEGTGLGLSTAFAIMRQSGGRIEVESEEGKGTCFRLFFCRRNETRASHQPHASAAARVLLVEDDVSLRGVAARMLRAQGFSVIESEDFASARERVRQSDARIDLFVIDSVESAAARHLARDLLDLRPGARVLLLSDDPDRESESDYPVLNKPFLPNALVHAVHDLLREDQADYSP